jgi:hypothetical protein
VNRQDLGAQILRASLQDLPGHDFPSSASAQITQRYALPEGEPTHKRERDRGSGNDPLAVGALHLRRSAMANPALAPPNPPTVRSELPKHYAWERSSAILPQALNDNKVRDLVLERLIEDGMSIEQTLKSLRRTEPSHTFH